MLKIATSYVRTCVVTKVMVVEPVVDVVTVFCEVVIDVVIAVVEERVVSWVETAVVTCDSSNLLRKYSVHSW